MKNKNIVAYTDGFRYRLEVWCANLMKSEPAFARTKAEAKKRRKALQQYGFGAAIFAISENGGLTQVR